jgi:hypothetical protein
MPIETAVVAAPTIPTGKGLESLRELRNLNFYTNIENLFDFSKYINKKEAVASLSVKLS